MDIEKLGPKAAINALKVIKSGGVVIFPTDTVYGFIARADSKKAVEKIFKIKKRLKTKPLAVFVKDIKMVKDLAEVSRGQIKIIKKYWPGKYTFVLKSKIKNKLITKNNTIAVRIPDYKYLNILLKKLNKPLVQTSVNISGQSNLSKISDIIKKFNNLDVLVVDGGNLKKSKPSK